MKTITFYHDKCQEKLFLQKLILKLNQTIQ